MPLLVSVFLAIKLVVVKGLVFLDDLLFHQLLKVPFELLLHELPVSVFGTVGAAVVALTGTALPPPAVGLVVAYPLAVVLVVSAVEGPTPKRVASYWLGSTVVTGSATIGLSPFVYTGSDACSSVAGLGAAANSSTTAGNLIRPHTTSARQKRRSHGSARKRPSRA